MQRTPETVRIFTACNPTPFLVVLHIRRNLCLPPAREFLMWSPLGPSKLNDTFLREVIPNSGFDDALEMTEFQSHQSRLENPLQWWFVAAKRYRADAKKVRQWMTLNHISPSSVELWLDEPLHFNGAFPKGYFHNAHHIKIPHCFNLDDQNTGLYRSRLIEKRNQVSWVKRHLFWPWIKLSAGIDLSTENQFAYEKAYSFDQPSPWARMSIDISDIITESAFKKTWTTLPAKTRKDIDNQLEQIVACKRPLLILLLFGLNKEMRACYQQAITKIFAEQRQLHGCSLLVKIHPGAVGIEESLFFDWLSNAKFPASTYILNSIVNLEMMLHRIKPDYVLAGPCGALPTIKRLRCGTPILLSTILDYFKIRYPGSLDVYNAWSRDYTTW